MNHSIESLAARLAELEAKNAICELKARYCRALDLRRVDDLRDTLLPEGAIIAYEGFPQFASRDAFIAVFEQMGCAPGVYDIHHAVNPDITLVSEDEATAQWSLHFKSIIMEHRTIITMGVEYDDRYVRQNGRWWIAETRTTRPFYLTEAVDADARPSYIGLGEAAPVYGDAPT